jgi:hypothetical protein
MSISATVFTGFYIQLTKRNFYKNIKVNACVNEDCSEYHEENKDNFCRKCGSKIELVEILKEIEVTDSHHILPEEYGNDFNLNERTFSLIPRSYGKNAKVPYSKSKNIMYGEVQFALDLLVIHKKLEELKKQSVFANITEYINSEFGENTAEIVFGVVAYAG